jgi:hypothetical protein
MAKRRHEKNIANYEKADPGGDRTPPPLSFAFVWTLFSYPLLCPPASHPEREVRGRKKRVNASEYSTYTGELSDTAAQ